MKRLPALVLLLLLSACAQPGASVVTPAVQPALSEPLLRALAERAFAGSSEVLATADARAASEVFSGSALGRLEMQAAHLALLKQRIQRNTSWQRLVHWRLDGTAGEAVLAVRGQERLLDGERATAWDDYAAQWDYRATWTGAWRICAATELSPQEWWPA